MFDGFTYVPYDWSLDAFDRFLLLIPVAGWIGLLFKKAAGFIRHHLEMMTEMFRLGLPDAPESFAGLCGEFAGYMQHISPLAEVMPWTQAGVAFGITLSGVVLGFGIRIVLSLVSVVRGAGV